DIRSGQGGDAVRQLVAGGLAYTEAGIGDAIAAVQQGAEGNGVNTHLNNWAQNVWAVMPDSPIKTIKDLKGRKMAYTNPGSPGQAIEVYFLNKLGYAKGDVTLVSAGGIGPGLTLL